MGNFAPFAPWTLLHQLPVISHMQVSGRFLIPAVFAFSMLAALALDHVLSGLDSTGVSETDASKETPRRWLARGAILLLVAVALADSFVVGRYSLMGAFPHRPPQIAPRLPSIVTVQKKAGTGQTQLMLANYCDISADEALPVPVKAIPYGQPDYRGELYFVPDSAEPSGEENRVVLLDWSPNSVRVGANVREPGWIVLNKNWATGWTSERPYEAASYQGLLVAHVEAGTHTVRFFYRPAIVLIGLGASLASFAIVAGVFFQSFRRLRS
jgi:hypothetical protein